MLVHTHPLPLCNPLASSVETASPLRPLSYHRPPSGPPRPTTRPRQKINVPCNPCIMHSHFVERTNERTARKFTSYVSLPPSLSLSSALLPSISRFSFVSLPRFLSILPRFSREILRVCNKPALTNPFYVAPTHAYAALSSSLSSLLLSSPLFLASRPLLPIPVAIIEIPAGNH